MISLVIPIYKNAGRVREMIEALEPAVLAQPTPMEVIVVDDGSPDGTWDALASIQKDWLRPIRFLHNTGKGAAVAAGVAQARGEYIFFTDADLPYDLSILDEAVRKLRAGADVVLGSRHLSTSRAAVTPPLLRRLSTKTFSLLANLLLLSPIADTQCGFKGFTKPAAQQLFSDLRIKRFSFDVEIIYLAQVNKYRIECVPVSWIQNGVSTVALTQDTLNMGWDLVKLFLRAQSTAAQMTRFAVVGAWNTLIHAVIFNILILTTNIAAGIPILAYSLIAYILTVTQSFFINRKVTFGQTTTSRTPSYYVKFFTVSSITAIVCSLVIFFLTTYVPPPWGIDAKIWANVALALTIPLAFGSNFFGYKFFVFKN